MRILIAEDHAETRETYMGFIKGAFPEIEIDEARNGRELGAMVVAAYIESRPYDLILTGNQMPERSGVDTVESIRGVYPRAQIVMMSSDDLTPDEREKIGNTPFVNKRDIHSNFDKLTEIITKYTPKMAE